MGYIIRIGLKIQITELLESKINFQNEIKEYKKVIEGLKIVTNALRLDIEMIPLFTEFKRSDVSIEYINLLPPKKEKYFLDKNEIKVLAEKYGLQEKKDDPQISFNDGDYTWWNE